MTMVKHDTAEIQNKCTAMAGRMADKMVKVGHSTMAIAEKSDKFKTRVLKALHDQFTSRMNDLREIRKQKADLNRMVETGIDQIYKQEIDPGYLKMARKIVDDNLEAYKKLMGGKKWKTGSTVDPPRYFPSGEAAGKRNRTNYEKDQHDDRERRDYENAGPSQQRDYEDASYS